MTKMSITSATKVNVVENLWKASMLAVTLSPLAVAWMCISTGGLWPLLFLPFLGGMLHFMVQVEEKSKVMDKDNEYVYECMRKDL